jgi:hypothetical protein
MTLYALVLAFRYIIIFKKNKKKKLKKYLKLRLLEDEFDFTYDFFAREINNNSMKDNLPCLIRASHHLAYILLSIKQSSSSNINYLKIKFMN